MPGAVRRLNGEAAASSCRTGNSRPLGLNPEGPGEPEKAPYGGGTESGLGLRKLPQWHCHSGTGREGRGVEARQVWAFRGSGTRWTKGEVTRVFPKGEVGGPGQEGGKGNVKEAWAWAWAQVGGVVPGPQRVRYWREKPLQQGNRRDPQRVSSQGAKGWKSWSCLFPDRGTEAVELSTSSGCKARAEAPQQTRTSVSFLRLCRGPVGCLSWFSSVRVNCLYVPCTPQLPLPTKQLLPLLLLPTLASHPQGLLMAWLGSSQIGEAELPAVPAFCLNGLGVSP